MSTVCVWYLLNREMSRLTNDDGCDDDTLHRDAERVRKYYDDVMTRMLEEEFETTKHTMSYGEWQRILNYINDRLKYRVRDSECKDFRLRVPFSCLISGKSLCGKTELLLTILSQLKYITTDHSGTYTKRIYWFYGTASIEQTNRVRQIFEEYRNEDGLGGHKDTDLHFVKVHTFKDDNVCMLLNEIHTAIVVFDGLMNEMCSDEMITNVLVENATIDNCVYFIFGKTYFHKNSLLSLSHEIPNIKLSLRIQRSDNNLKRCSFICIHMITNAYIRKLLTFFIVSHRANFPLLCLENHGTRKNRDCTIIGYAVNRNVEDVKNHIFTTPPVVIL